MSQSQNKPENKEKKMTSYDRKLEARKKQAEIERRNKKMSWAAVITVCICIIGVILFTTISSALSKRTALNNTYITVGEHEITQLEYTFYYNYTVNNYLNYYSSIGLLPYMGLDTSVDFAKQQYTETMTWKDAFDQMTVNRIQSTKALLDDAKVNNFEYNTSEEYEDFKTDFKESADEAGYTVKNFYKAMYGTYATQRNVKPFILDTYTATAYEEELLEQNKPTDDEITVYYEENKDNYDLVDYRSFTFTADVEEDDTEDVTENIISAMEDLKKKAEAMKAEREAGTDFEALCIKYASEDEKTDYEEKENSSLAENAKKSDITEPYSDWLYEEGRTNGDITIIEDEENYKYYVVEFVQRTYDENCTETISGEIAYERLTEYLENLTTTYEVKDIKGDLYYLTIEPEEENVDEEE